MKRTVIFILLILMAAACAKSLSTQSIGTIDAIPKENYTLYLYSAGTAERLRTVFIQSPDSGVEVVPSAQVVKETGSASDAIRFMEKSGMRTRVEKVMYQGRTIGYLLTSDRHSFGAKQWLDVSLYERRGKIYFTATEQRQES
jgi:hypothetical protein